jgi:hypothetical protein
LVADAGLLVACLVELLGQSAEGARGAEAKEASLAAINQSHKLRLEVIKLIASITEGARGGAAPHSSVRPSTCCSATSRRARCAKSPRAALELAGVIESWRSP